MDFTELEAVEGLRWPWHSWPRKPSDAHALVVPLSIICTPLAASTASGDQIPVLPYQPLRCARCTAALNPYSRVDAAHSFWACTFCLYARNPFPRRAADAGEERLTPELFPTFSSVEYTLTGPPVPPPAVVFVVDLATDEVELRVLKNEISRCLNELPEGVRVGLVSFGASVWVHELEFFGESSRVMVINGQREISSIKIQQLLGIDQLHSSKLGTVTSRGKQSFILPLSRCEFNITTAIEELYTRSGYRSQGHRPLRATGAAISTAVALLEGCSGGAGGRVVVFTSGPATLGPGMIAETDLSSAIRSHRDIFNSNAPLSDKANEFYKLLGRRLSESSIVLDIFACSLDQVGVAELRYPTEISGGLVVLTESFESEQFKKCLRHLFKRDGDHLNMYFDSTIEVVTSEGVKICGALGPCISRRTKSNSVSEKEIGEGGTNSWMMSTLTCDTSIAFFFDVSGDKPVEPPAALFVQFLTRFRQGDGGLRLRVTTAARRWVARDSPEIASGFDQEAAASIMARLAVNRAQTYHVRDVIRWLDRMLVQFTAKFGRYTPEDPSTFRLSSNFTLYPQFMYYLRRSQFIDVFNSSPDETAFARLVLNREGVVGSLVMIRPTLFQYSFDGPPVPVLLDISSVSPDVILLFDSYFYIVIHYGSKIAQWRKHNFDKDPTYENFRKLLEAPVIDAEALIKDRIPVPKLIKCDQYSSQARFLLARLNPSVTQKTQLIDGSEVILTDDVSLEVFIEHLQELAVQG